MKDEPYADFNFADPYKAAEEFDYLCKFCYRKTLVKFMAAWTSWIDANQPRMLLTPQERQKWAALEAKVHAARPENLMPLVREMCAWWDDYARS